jgi:transketolase
MRNASTQVVYDLIKRDKNVMALTADNRNEIWDQIRQEYPTQYVDYGIAESNMVASAAGLASCGKIPFLYTITNFMSMRAFEFIRNDVCIANQNVKFLGRSSGLVSSSMGPTHQGTEELALLRGLPNLLVFSPATPIEARQMTLEAYRYEGPVYIRLEGYNEPELYDEAFHFEIGRGTILRKGTDITIIGMGSILNEALQAARQLAVQADIQVRVIDMPVTRPIDTDLILQAMRETRGIITLEEHSIYGGLGSAVAEAMAENCSHVPLYRMGLDGCAHGCGNREVMRRVNGIGLDDLLKAVHRILKN